VRWPRRLAGTLVAALAGAAPAVGVAQSTSTVVLYGGGQPALQQSGSVRVTGELTVDFHGDAASGCAARGLCGYSGWVAWRPAPSGTLTIEVSRIHGRLVYSPSLQLVDLRGIGLGGGETGASVQFANGPPGASPSSSHCLDAVPTGTSVPLAVRRGRVVVSLARATPQVLDDRCAGPRYDDVAAQLPSPTLSLGAVRHGDSVVSLIASHAFSAHGFAGTIRSTIVIHLGRLGRLTKLSAGRIRAGKRYRQVTVTYRARVDGLLTARFRGASDPAICGPLGSCGAVGSVELAPRVRNGRAALTLYAPLSEPLARVLATVGLGRAPNLGRPVAAGFLAWTGGGAIREGMVQGAARCRDSDSMRGGELILGAGKGRFVGEYLAAGLDVGGGSFSGTDCPGPGGGYALLASGRTPSSVLSRRTVTLTLDTGSRFEDYGYRVVVTPRVTLTLTRLRAHATVVTVPPGFSL
jgi:hypothetical protein